MRYDIRGRVVDDLGDGIAGVRVEAWDKVFIHDDQLGSAGTITDGSFSISFDENAFNDIFLDKRPDLYFKVFCYNKRLCCRNCFEVRRGLADPAPGPHGGGVIRDALSVWCSSHSAPAVFKKMAGAEETTLPPRASVLVTGQPPDSRRRRPAGGCFGGDYLPFGLPFPPPSTPPSLLKTWNSAARVFVFCGGGVWPDAASGSVPAGSP